MDINKYNRRLNPCPVCRGKVEIVLSRAEDYLDTDVICSKCGYELNIVEDVWQYKIPLAVKEWNIHCKEFKNNIEINLDQ